MIYKPCVRIIYKSITHLKFYEDLEKERARVLKSIERFGWTSDHNLDWWACSIISSDGIPIFVEFEDGSGLLTHRYSEEWRIWSDPLCDKNDSVAKVEEFALEIFKNNSVKNIWCDDVSDKIYLGLKSRLSLKDFAFSPLNPTIKPEIKENYLPYYHLFWPVLEMAKYDPSLRGGHFKEIRNARNKFYKERKVKVLKTSELSREDLLKIIDDWTSEVTRKQKEDVYDLKYRLIIKNNFRGFSTARVMVVDGRPVGLNAGYDVPNHPGRFAGVIGLHDYSVKDLGAVLYLEDLDWIKNTGYKELDMQGTEYEWELKVKTQFGAAIERKTDTFSIQKQGS